MKRVLVAVGCSALVAAGGASAGATQAARVASDAAVAGSRSVHVTCSATRAAFHAPLGGRLEGNDDFDSSQLTANRNGLWAGTTRRAALSAVIDWRPGRPAHVLSRFAYTHSGALLSGLRVTGITVHGNVVATVPRDSSRATSDGYVWVHGRGHRLPEAKAWTSVTTLGATDDGRILGLVRTKLASTGQPVYEFVRWNEAGTKFTTFGPPSRSYFSALSDAAGDVSWEDGRGFQQVLLVNGRRVNLGQLVNPLIGGTGASFVGVPSDERLSSWDLRGAAAGRTVAHRPLEPKTVAVSLLTAVGPHHEVTFETQRNGNSGRLRTAGGALVRMPRQLQLISGNLIETLNSIDAHGSVAYTATDGLVHFFRCR